MKYESVHDEQYKGRDITIYQHDDSSFTVDVKHPCGELIAGWCDIEDFESAMQIAKEFICELKPYRKSHCGDEYCIEAVKASQ